MKKYLIILLFAMQIDFTHSQSLPDNDSNWELVFNDDFNTIDPAIWWVRSNFDHYAVLGEAQVYTDRPNNVFLESGSLVLQAQEEAYLCDPAYVNVLDCATQFTLQQQNLNLGTSTYEGYDYTSGWIETQSTIPNLHYGYFESRIKLPYGHGFWPAYWLFLKGGIAGINDSEIDIVENVGRPIGLTDPYGFTFIDNVTKMGTNIHYGYCSEADEDDMAACPDDPINYTCPFEGCNGQEIELGEDYTLDYHTYAVEWSPTRIIWYYDNRPVRTLIYHEIHDPVKIIFNFALKKSLLDGTSSFPAQMKIDYVKVYKLKTDCNQSINTCVYDFPSHDNKLKNEITIGGIGCENAVSPGTNTYLHAGNYVELSGDFTVPVGATFVADANGECFNTLPINNCSYLFNPCNYNFAGYDNGVKKVITLGQTGCSATISSGSTISLKATDEITLKPGFTASSGSDVEIKIVNCE